jgi:hypothetical protein
LRSKRQVADRIIKYLYEIAPDEVNAHTVSRVLRLNSGSVRKELSRILARKDSPLVRTHRGFYRHKVELDLLAKIDTCKRIEMHGVQFLGVCLNENTGYSIANAAKHKYRKRGTYQEVVEDRKVTITVHSNGTVQVFVNASGNPLTFPQFDRLQTWVKAKLDFVDEYSWKLSQIGLNVDQRGLDLDGVTSVRLAVFRNAWFQVYRKGEDTVRWETHICPNLNLTEAVMILRQLTECEPRKEAQKKEEDSYQAPPDPDPGHFSYG